MDIQVKHDALNDCLNNLSELIQIKSLKGEPSPDAPFGDKINDALLYVLNIANRFGFKTKNLDGYAGIVEIGSGEDELGIFVHVDVVPAEDEKDWLHPPYSGKITKEAIWGRGALDNKGPAIAVLYAMKMLQEMSVTWDKRIRLVIGTDEESDWECIAHYKEKEELPTISFTPDGCFPVTNGEKGLLTLSYETEMFQESVVLQVESGDRYNMTPGSATAVLSKDISLEKVREYSAITVRDTTKGYEVIAEGEEGASASPNKGKNAIHIMLKFLKDVIPINDPFTDVITFYEKYLEATDGQGHGLKVADEVSGSLTLAAVKLNVDKGHIRFASNIRYPVTFKKDDILQMCKKSLQASSFHWDVVQLKEAVYIPEEDPYIKELLDIYHSYFHEKEEPVSISGATYARAIPNMVAFGALIPGKPLNAHMKNEHVEISVVRDWINIYAKTMYELAAVKEGR